MSHMDVILTLDAQQELSRTALEEATVAILEVVEERCAEIALGPAASCDFETHAIRLVFQVAAASPAEAHRKIGEILGEIERATTLVVDGTDMAATTRRNGLRDHDLIPA